MSSGMIGYHPERVADLAHRTRLVVDDLAGIGSDDPVAAGAVGEVRRALRHLETGWLPLLERIQTSAAMTAPIDVDPGDGRSWFDAATDAMLGAAPGDGRTVIAPIVAGFSDAEREFFQGFVDERAPQVAAELSLFDAHPDYAIDALPVELRRLDDRNEWMWLATLYLQEQYHHMIDTGAVELQRDGDAYWIDPIDLTDTNKVIGAEIILAAVASAGGFRRGSGFSAATAKTATSPLPKARTIASSILSPKTFDPATLRGLTPSHVQAMIPPGWTVTSSSTGGGTVYGDPLILGRHIRVMPGYPPGSRPDTMKTGPYVVVAQNGSKTSVPLAGNPTL